MARMARFFWMLAVAAAVLRVPHAAAQAPQAVPAPSSPSAIEAVFPNPLPGLPRPGDTPASLMAPPAPTSAPVDLSAPYFQPDPLLDPPQLPQPGWFTGLDLAVVGPHVKNRLTDTVQVGTRPTDTVHAPTADLDWTVAPDVELGYRLPAGFGAFALT